MLVDGRVSQEPYIIPGPLAHGDPLIEHFERWTRAHLAHGFSLQEAARDPATSPRTLQWRAEAVLGRSLLAYFQDRRVERARRYSTSSGFSIARLSSSTNSTTARGNVRPAIVWICRVRWCNSGLRICRATRPPLARRLRAVR